MLVAMAERVRLCFFWCILFAVFLFAQISPGQTKPDIIVFNEDDPIGAGYYDASVPVVVAPSSLTTATSPNGGKLPILTNIAFAGNQSGLVEWRSAPQGNWTWFVASPGFQSRDLTGYSNVVFFVNGPMPIPATK